MRRAKAEEEGLDEDEEGEYDLRMVSPTHSCCCLSSGASSDTQPHTYSQHTHVRFLCVYYIVRGSTGMSLRSG